MFLRPKQRQPVSPEEIAGRLGLRSNPWRWYRRDRLRWNDGRGDGLTI